MAIYPHVYVKNQFVAETLDPSSMDDLYPSEGRRVYKISDKICSGPIGTLYF